MNLPRFSVHRPIFATMVTLIVVILGAVSFNRLRIDMLPEIELPTLSIRTDYEGASPEVMEQMVTQIVEEIVGTVEGVEEITSNSREGRSSVTVRFAWGTDLDVAALDLQATLEDEINELPDDIDHPRVSKFDINSYPVVLLGISSSLDPVSLTQLIEEQIRYRFARVPGVAQVDTWGHYPREIRVALDPDRVRALGIALNDVTSALVDANLDLPTGTISDGALEVTLRAPAQYADVDEIRDTVIDVRDGAPVTIGQIAEVSDTHERLTRMIRVNGDLGIRIAIRKQSEANTVEVSRAILEEIEQTNRDFPQIEVVPITNQGNFIERSIQNVGRSVIYGGGLAVVILLFFLRSFRSTIVISLSIPISIIATFALIYFGGFTLNMMTLGGLALGVGMMVDSSIVVLENIFRQRDEFGRTPVEAAELGAREVSSAIIASTLTTLVIFLPLTFAQGVSGILFNELAYVIAFSLICSLLVALSLVPMLSARLLRPKETSLRTNNSGVLGRFLAFSERWLLILENGYRDLISKVLRHRWKTLVGALSALGLSLLLLPFIGSELMPPSDEGEVYVQGEMAIGTRLEIVDELTRRMEAVVDELVPERIASVASARNEESEIRIALPPSSERSRSNAEVADQLRSRLEGAIPGMEIRVRAPQGQFLLDRVIGESSDGISIEVRGYEFSVLDQLAERVAAEIADIPGITDIDVSREDRIPQQEIRVDRAKVADLGLTIRDVTQALRIAVAGVQAGEYRTGGYSYPIHVRMQDSERMSIDEVLSLTLSIPGGEQVALRNLVETQASEGPVEIDRKDQQRLTRVFAHVAGRDLGSVAEEVDTRLTGILRPDGYDLRVAGNFEEQQEASRELMVSLLLAVVLVYMVLACQYESLREPVVVMFAVPMAAIGVLLTLFLTGTTLNLQSYMGCIMLGGIVVNNAILLVDQAGQLKNSGQPVNQAIAEAGRRRLRPILMTTLTTIIGLLPLALGIGEGADAQAPLARAVIGGLLGSTLITLVLIPAMYSLFYNKEVKEVVQ